MARLPHAALLLASALLLGCGAPEPVVQAPEIPAPQEGVPLHFRFETLDGKELSPATLAGRISVLGLVATYDTASQAEARFLAELAHSHTPRINVALIVLEPPENRPMVEAFASVIRFQDPVALADEATIEGHGPFGGVHHVPSVVILDREGRLAYQHVGLAEREEIEKALRAIEGRAAR